MASDHSSPLEPGLVALFASEVALHCQIGLDAAAAIDRSAGDITATFRSIHQLLAATSTITKVFWGAAADDADRLERQSLRKSFTVADTSPIAPSSAYWNFESYADRLIDWFRADPTAVVLARDIASPGSTIGGSTAPISYQGYDPYRRVIYSGPDALEIEVSAVVGELERLLTLAPRVEATAESQVRRATPGDSA